MKLARALGYLWSSPYGLLGLLLWLGFRAAGAKPLPCGCPLALDCSKLALGRRMAAHDWAAFTLAWTILVWDPEPDDRLLIHEGRHITQALALGPLYPAVYLGLWFGCICVLTAEAVWARAWRLGNTWEQLVGNVLLTAYQMNPLERDARRAAGEEV